MHATYLPSIDRTYQLSIICYKICKLNADEIGDNAKNVTFLFTPVYNLSNTRINNLVTASNA